MGYTCEPYQAPVFHFDTTAERIAFPFTSNHLGSLVFDDQEDNVYLVRGSGIAPTMSFKLGAIRQTPKQLAFAASLTLDCSTSNSFQIADIVTSDFALTLINGKDGDSGTLIFKQAAAGGKKITGITVTGRTKEMDDALTTLNTPNMLGQNTHCILTYAFYTTGTDACVRFWMNTGAAAAFT